MKLIITALITILLTGCQSITEKPYVVMSDISCDCSSDKYFMVKHGDDFIFIPYHKGDFEDGRE